MKKLKNSKIIKVLGILIILYFILLVICRNTDYDVIVRKPKNEEEKAYLGVAVPLRVHFKKVCLFPDPKYSSRKYRVKFKNGLVIPVRLALELWLVDLDDLQKKGFPCDS